MAQGALWSGMALANAGLGAAHGFAAPLGGLLGAPHGAICGALLAPVTKANIAALRRKGADAERFRQVAVWVTGLTEATAEEGATALATLAAQLSIPGLATHGLTKDLIPDLCTRAKQASSMKANPVVLSDEELANILCGAL
jgi:alcohol dehydrogenase class IV